jgi:hypothetical protein
MPWILIPGALRRLRRGRKLDRKEAAKLLGLHEWTISRHESDGPLTPRTLRAEFVKVYRRGYQCDAEAFVRWVDHDDEPAKRKPRAKKLIDPAAPQLGTLTERAKHEITIGAQQTINGLEVVGNAIIRECMTACALHAGERYAVQGTVTQHDYLPEIAARVLGAPVGEGARFRFDRQVVKGLPVYVTVMTTTLDHTRYLVEAHKSEKTVAVIVRVVAKPPAEEWKGFLIFEKRPVFRPWTFVVEGIATDGAADT